MFVLTVILSLLLAGVLIASAAGKLTKSPQVMAQMSSVGVATNTVPMLAGVELLAAAGLLIGLGVAILGILAALGSFVYFALAVGAHARIGDLKHAPPAGGLAALSLLVLIFRAVSA